MAEEVVRKRGWFVERNWEYDRNDPTSKYHGVDEDTWRDGILKEWTDLAQDKKVDWCHFIFHDSDEEKDKETGKITIKPIHAHAVVRYKEARTQSAVMKDFCGSNQRSENCQWVDPRQGGFRSALLYLTHHTTSAYNKEKTWYHHSQVYQFGKRYLDLIKTDKRQRKNSQDIELIVDEFTEKIARGELSLFDAKQQFKALEGARALTRYKPVFESADEDYQEVLIKDMQRLSALGKYSKRTTYISGPGRVGKSLLAKCLAIDLYGEDDVYVPPAGGSSKITNDFVDLYHRQKATVFNDLEPTEYGFKAFLNMFDPNEWMPTRSRNKSKAWLSTDCYIADNKPLGEFLIRMINGDRGGTIALSHETANDFVMGFGRVQRVLTFGVNSQGDPVVWVGRLVNPIPTDSQTIIDYAKSNIGNFFNSRIIGMFYDTLGYVPYDKNAPVYNERMRVAKIINAVYEGNLNINGFVKI